MLMFLLLQQNFSFCSETSLHNKYMKAHYLYIKEVAYFKMKMHNLRIIYKTLGMKF